MAGNLEKMFEDLKTSIMDAVKGSQAPAPPTIPVTQTEELSDGMSPALRELLGTQDGVDELGRKATEIAQDAIRVEKRKLHTVEFVAGVVGGTKEKPFGLRIKAADLVALLLSLPEKQARAVEKVLSQTLDAAIDFSEHGYDTEGFLRKPTLPKEYRLSVETWLASGKPLGKFFEANPEVGKAEDFNLAEFIPEAKEK